MTSDHFKGISKSPQSHFCQKVNLKGEENILIPCNLNPRKLLLCIVNDSFSYLGKYESNKKISFFIL